MCVPRSSAEVHIQPMSDLVPSSSAVVLGLVAGSVSSLDTVVPLTGGGVVRRTVAHTVLPTAGVDVVPFPRLTDPLGEVVA